MSLLLLLQEPPAELSGLGYRHVFGQLYSAMAQRVPPELLAKYYRSVFYSTHTQHINHGFIMRYALA